LERAYVEVVADGVDLLAGPLAEPVAPHLVQHLVHLPSWPPLLLPAPQISCGACLMNKLVFLSWLYRYDAVTVNGKLGWQDKLNKYNKPFFDLCDGIFVNYTWKVNLLSFAGPPQSRLNDDLKILE
jgi:hypothetical protein